MPTVTLAHIVSHADIDAALRDVESACSIETANLLRATFAAFRLLSNGAHLETNLAHGTDEQGKSRVFLVMRFPDADVAGPALQP